MTQWRFRGGHESQLHRDTKAELFYLLNDNKHLWIPPERPGFSAQAFCEYVYPVEGKNLGRHFTWPKILHGMQLRNVEHALELGYTPMFIFDVAIETEIGLLEVYEVVNTSPVKKEKKEFLRAIGLPLTEHHIGFVESPKRHIKARSLSPRERALRAPHTPKPVSAFDMPVLTRARDALRRLCALPPLPEGPVWRRKVLPRPPAPPLPPLPGLP